MDETVITGNDDQRCVVVENARICSVYNVLRFYYGTIRSYTLTI